MKHARSLLLIGALERKKFGGVPGQGFKCPGPQCEEYFEHSKVWVEHAVRLGHYMYAKALLVYEEDFAKHTARVEQGFQKGVYEVIKQLRDRRREMGRDEQEEDQRAFREQLEHDP